MVSEYKIVEILWFIFWPGGISRGTGIYLPLQYEHINVNCSRCSQSCVPGCPCCWFRPTFPLCAECMNVPFLRLLSMLTGMVLGLWGCWCHTDHWNPESRDCDGHETRRSSKHCWPETWNGGYPSILVMIISNQTWLDWTRRLAAYSSCKTVTALQRGCI